MFNCIEIWTTLSHWKRLLLSGNTVCQSNIHMDARIQGFPAEHGPKHHTASSSSLPSSYGASWCHSAPQVTHMRPSAWCNIKCDLSGKTTFFHCSVLQFWCLDILCLCFQLWTEVNIGALTGLQLCSSICNKLQCTVYSDTFLSKPALPLQQFKQQ